MKISPSGPELLSLRIKREPGPPGTSRSSSGHPSHDILLLKRRGEGGGGTVREHEHSSILPRTDATINLCVYFSRMVACSLH